MGSTTWPAPNSDPLLDRIVSDVQYEQLAAMYSGSGLYGDPSLASLVYADGTGGRVVKWRPNRMGLVMGHPWRSDGDGVVSAIAAAPSARVDLAVLRYDRATYLVTPAIRQGQAGGTAPAPVQEWDATVGSSLWELPVAEITVPAGATAISAANVKSVAWYLGPQPLVATSTTMPPPRPGLEVMQTDKGRRVMAIGSSWHVLGENGPSTRLPVATGWDSTRNFVYVQRRNGMTYLQALIYRATGTADVAAGVDVTMYHLPADFRPAAGAQEINCGGFHGDYQVRIYYDPNTSNMVLVSHEQPLKAGQFVITNPICFPSA